MNFFLSYVLILSISLLFGSAGFAQQERFPSGSSNESGKWRFGVTEKGSPELAKFEKKLSNLQFEINKVIIEYQQKKISREKAKEKLMPLLKEQQETKNSLEYLAELTLSSRFGQQRF
ncbi:MAG: hypothetical protein WC546_05540 [Candidatus Omnitrophota bacterium]